MSFSCLDCSEEFDSYDDAQEHYEATDHGIGLWRSGRENERGTAQ